MTDLSLYGEISMSLLIGLLVGLIVLALLDRGDDTTPAITSILLEARADQQARSAVLGTPASEQPLVPLTTRMQLPPRGQGITIDVHAPGRHRRVTAMPGTTQRPSSYAKMGLNEALAWLAVDRVRRDAEHSQFLQLIRAA
jgi:hypothetical protein